MSSNFFIAFRVLAPERRAALTEVYRFCRLADDAVDEAATPDAARQELTRVRERLDEAFLDSARPGATGLGGAVRRFALPRGPFDELLEGVSWDIVCRRYDGPEELEEYCYRVASTVGLLCVRIFGCGDGSCDRYARELGIALQWTNILRDIGVDLARGRIYLTRESMREHGLEDGDLQTGGAETRMKLDALIRTEADRARSAFARAARALPDRWRREMLSGRIMGAVYRSLLERVDRAGSAVLDREVRVPGPARAWIAARIWIRDRTTALRPGAA